MRPLRLLRLHRSRRLALCRPVAACGLRRSRLALPVRQGRLNSRAGIARALLGSLQAGRQRGQRATMRGPCACPLRSAGPRGLGAACSPRAARTGTSTARRRPLGSAPRGLRLRGKRWALGGARVGGRPVRGERAGHAAPRAAGRRRREATAHDWPAPGAGRGRARRAGGRGARRRLDGFRAAAAAGRGGNLH